MCDMARQFMPSRELSVVAAAASPKKRQELQDRQDEREAEAQRDGATPGAAAG